MFQHLILGLLRGGKPGHGYGLAGEYERLSGNQGYSANASRKLHKLEEHGLVTREPNTLGDDERRVPYAITAKGCEVFDAWLVSWTAIQKDFSTWILFADRVPAGARERLLERREEELWFALKSINRERDDALARIERNGNARFSAAAVQLLRRSMQIHADLEFIRELRKELGGPPQKAPRKRDDNP